MKNGEVKMFKRSKFLGKFKIYRLITRFLFGWKWTKDPGVQLENSMKNDISRIWTPRY